MDHIKHDRPRTSPKDFFMHLLNMVMLYVAAFGFGRLLFMMINYYYPDIQNPTYENFFDTMRWSISSIIVAYPAYILTSKYLIKEYQVEPEKKNLRVKNWLEYLTLFGTAVIILIDVMTLVYYFLGGEITIRFILKIITVIFIAGVIFTYYLIIVKENLAKKRAIVIRIIFWLSTVAIVASIVGGYLSVGSPSLARSNKFDQMRIDNLSLIQNEIINYWSRTRKLPADIGELANVNQTSYPVDPETNTPYEYNLTGELTFDLCANFDQAKQPSTSGPTQAYPGAYGGNLYNQIFTAGRNCFPYTIHPELYPAPAAPSAVPIK